jgi:hypothetical protein
MFSFFTHQDHGNQNPQLSNTVSSISILPNYTSNTSQLKERQARLKTRVAVNDPYDRQHLRNNTV